MSIKKKIISSAMALALLLGLFTGVSPLKVRVAAVSQSEIDALQEKRDKLAAQAEEQQALIDDLTEQKALVVQRKQALDAKIELNQQEIDLLNSQIELYDELIAEKQQELDKAQEKETEQSERLRARMRTMEESGNLSYIAFLFEATSFTDLLGRLSDVDDIMHYDQKLEKEYMAAKEDVAAIKESYEATQLEQQALVKELDARQEQLDAQIDAACELIADLLEQSDVAQEELDAIAKLRSDAEDQIADLIAKRAAEQAAAAAAQQKASGSTSSDSTSSDSTSSGVSSPGVQSLSSFMWPVPSCVLITSRFGYRVSPTAGASTYHGGLDIGAQQGATIVAAQSGEVILAGECGGYGNCVMIDHGDSIVTVYGHMSSIAVSVGSYVTQGQCIGYVGSTGVSTGPHLHFEIRINGSQTDPAVYFSNLDYSYCG